MRRVIVTVLTAGLVLLAWAPAVSAQALGPCNNGQTNVASVAEGATGFFFATHHISALAKLGALGSGGHVPGTHHGFSACNPSGR